ncbi:MAG: hypothetical protein ACO4AI_05185 [Prochlorothrix sp.]
MRELSRPGLATPVWSGAVTVLLRHYDAPLGLAFRVLSMIRRSPRPPLQNQAFEQALEELRDKLEGLQQRYESVCAEQVRLAVLAQEIQAATRAQPEAGGAARVNTGKLGLENSNLGRLSQRIPAPPTPVQPIQTKFRPSQCTLVSPLMTRPILMLWILILWIAVLWLRTRSIRRWWQRWRNCNGNIGN